MFLWQVRYMRLPPEAAPTGDMFHRGIEKMFEELPHVFGINDAILIVRYDDNSVDHDRTLCWVLQSCRK